MTSPLQVRIRLTFIIPIIPTDYPGSSRVCAIRAGRSQVVDNITTVPRIRVVQRAVRSKGNAITAAVPSQRAVELGDRMSAAVCRIGARPNVPLLSQERGGFRVQLVEQVAVGDPATDPLDKVTWMASLFCVPRPFRLRFLAGSNPRPVGHRNDRAPPLSITTTVYHPGIGLPLLCKGQ